MTAGKCSVVLSVLSCPYTALISDHTHTHTHLKPCLPPASNTAVKQFHILKRMNHWEDTKTDKAEEYTHTKKQGGRLVTIWRKRKWSSVWSSRTWEHTGWQRQGGECWCKYLHVSSIKTGRQAAVAGTLCHTHTHTQLQSHTVTQPTFLLHTHTPLSPRVSNHSHDVSIVKARLFYNLNYIIFHLFGGSHTQRFYILVTHTKMQHQKIECRKTTV